METPKMVVFVVKRYAVCKAKIRRYAVRKRGVGITLVIVKCVNVFGHVIVILWLKLVYKVNRGISERPSSGVFTLKTGNKIIFEYLDYLTMMTNVLWIIIKCFVKYQLKVNIKIYINKNNKMKKSWRTYMDNIILGPF